MSVPRVVGLAGPYCAGKNTLLPFFLERGYAVLDLDRIGHQALEDSSKDVAAAFGSEVLNSDGAVDRRKLGPLVFKSRERLKRLEAIVHPAMKIRVVRELSAAPDMRFVLNAAILYTMELDRFCDAVVWVDAPWTSRWIRAMKRDRIGPFEALKRIYMQRHLGAQARARSADIIIVENRGDLEASLQALRHQWEKRYGVA